jgi:DDE superfamily endonuclease
LRIDRTTPCRKHSPQRRQGRGPLVPELRPRDIVIMDNLPAHKVHGVRQAIEAAGASLRYLPPYSPDFNPIEMAFARPRPSPLHPARNAPTTSPPRDTMQPERKML